LLLFRICIIVVIMNSCFDHFRIGVRYVMQQRGLSQKTLAIDVLVTQGTISKLLSGKNEGTVRLRESIAAVLDMPVVDLVEIGRRVVGAESVEDKRRWYRDDLSELFSEFPKLREYLEMAQRALRMGNRELAVITLRDISKALDGVEDGDDALRGGAKLR